MVLSVHPMKLYTCNDIVLSCVLCVAVVGIKWSTTCWRLFVGGMFELSLTVS